MWVIYLFNILFFSYAVRISPQNTQRKLLILPKYGALIWAVSGIDGQIRSLGYSEVPNAHNFIYIYNWLINKNDLFLHNFICINWNFYFFYINHQENQKSFGDPGIMYFSTILLHDFSLSKIGKFYLFLRRDGANKSWATYFSNHLP